jgi:D-inositol-3-phosphate glycosyltransferase
VGFRTRIPRVAIVAHDLADRGGISTAAEFLYGVLRGSGRYEPQLISLATSASDACSVRLRSPSSWLRGVQVRTRQERRIADLHVGAYAVELEFQRYRPRPELTRLLQTFDLVQFVVGAPPWACSAGHVARPRLLWTATTVRADRQSRLTRLGGARRLWTEAMTAISAQLENRALRDADTVFALSEYTMAAVAGRVPSERLRLAVCGVDTNLFSPGPSSHASYILCVGRLNDPRKNISLLLRAFAGVASRCEGMHLVLAGEPPSRDDQAQIGAFGLHDRIKVVGRVPLDELRRLYRQAAIFVLPSDEEGLGIVALEAMASGLPVISTRNGGAETAVRDGETGLLTPVGDPGALARAIEQLWSDPLRRLAMGETGRRRAEKVFSIAAAGSIFLERYDALAEGCDAG